MTLGKESRQTLPLRRPLPLWTVHPCGHYPFGSPPQAAHAASMAFPRCCHHRWHDGGDIPVPSGMGANPVPVLGGAPVAAPAVGIVGDEQGRLAPASLTPLAACR